MCGAVVHLELGRTDRVPAGGGKKFTKNRDQENIKKKKKKKKEFEKNKIIRRHCWPPFLKSKKKKREKKKEMIGVPKASVGYIRSLATSFGIKTSPLLWIAFDVAWSFFFLSSFCWWRCVWLTGGTQMGQHQLPRTVFGVRSFSFVSLWILFLVTWHSSRIEVNKARNSKRERDGGETQNKMNVTSWFMTMKKES